jgi:hypothetical protein
MKRSFKHWSPAYIAARIRLMAYEHSHKDAPWLTSTMIGILDSWLRPDDYGFEWGSGRSTLWFGKRVACLTSVEHDGTWYDKVSSQIDAEGLRGRVHHLLRPDGIEERAESDYVGAINSYPNASLDFCLIDGVSRSQCAIVALQKIRPGGILILDNCNWYLPSLLPTRSPNSRTATDGFSSEPWEVFSSRVADWRNIWTSNGVSDTCLWIRPST